MDQCCEAMDEITCPTDGYVVCTVGFFVPIVDSREWSVDSFGCTVAPFCPNGGPKSLIVGASGCIDYSFIPIADAIWSIVHSFCSIHAFNARVGPFALTVARGTLSKGPLQQAFQGKHVAAVKSFVVYQVVNGLVDVANFDAVHLAYPGRGRIIPERTFGVVGLEPVH